MYKRVAGKLAALSISSEASHPSGNSKFIITIANIEQASERHSRKNCFLEV